jgi:serine phosphatase RsbU (regulator of sigma subunit)
LDQHGGRTVLATEATFSEAVALRGDQRSYLVVMHDHEPEGRYTVAVEPLTVGRDVSRDVVLADDKVSRLHLQVAMVGGEVVVQDLGSSNGTFLDGRRLTAPTPLPAGQWIQVGSRQLVHERRSYREVEREDELAREIRKARTYVEGLLPAAVPAGPIRTDWFHRPSLQLGGDVFSYGVLDDGHIVAYLIDVSGHGVTAAMHSVSVLNVLRQRALPGTDFRDPAQVLSRLNDMFPMDAHDGMYFTIWYGVYSAAQRVLSFASGGHHPGYLHVPGQPLAALRTGGRIIGALPDSRYATGQVPVPSGAVLYLFSDGAFEITDTGGRQCALADFLPLLGGARAGSPGEAEHVYRAVRDRAKPGPLDDDFSFLAVGFE